MSFLVKGPREDRSGVTGRFSPKFWTLDMPLECSGSIRTVAPNGFQVDGVFRRNNDVAGAIWWTDHKYDHPRYKYEAKPDYTGCVLDFDIELSGDCGRLDTVYGTSLALAMEDGSNHFVRLWNYRSDRTSTDPYKQHIRIPFTSDLYSGYYDPFDGTRSTDYLNRVRVPTGAIKQVMLPVTPRDYLGGTTAKLSDELEAGDFRLKVEVPNGALLSSGDVINIKTPEGTQQVTIAGDPGSDRGPVVYWLDAHTIRFSWNRPVGAVGEVAYEISVKTPGGTWTPVGTTTALFLDFPEADYLDIYGAAPTELEWRVKLAEGLSPFAFGTGAISTEAPDGEGDYPRVHGSTWGDVVFTWPQKAGVSLYEISVLNGANQYEVLGTTAHTYWDFPVEQSVPMYGYTPTVLQWRVRAVGATSYFFEYQSQVITTNAFVKHCIPFMGQSNAVGHFTTLSGDEGRRDLVSAAAFRRQMADALGLRHVCVMPLECCWGSSAADRMADDDPEDGRNYWWDLNNDQPGPRLKHAIGLMKSVGVVPQDAVWAQGENDLSYTDAGWAYKYEGEGMTQPTLARLQQAWEKIFAYLRQEVNPNLHIYIQELCTPWYGSPPYQVIPDGYAAARGIQEAMSSPVPTSTETYAPSDPVVDVVGIGEIPAIFNTPAITQIGFYWDVRVPIAYNGSTMPAGTFADIKTLLNAPTVEHNNMTLRVTNITVSGSNSTLAQDTRPEPANTWGMTDGYDNAYNLTPEFCAERTYTLGYRGDYVLYTGISHFHNFSRTTGVFDTNVKWRLHTEGERVNRPTKLWLADFATHLKARGFELWISVSYEILKAIMPPEWIQVSATGGTSTTGWYPPSGLVEPTSEEGTRYLANVATEWLAVCVANGLPPKYQIGEPWWWDGSYSDGKPCFYSQTTRNKYYMDTGRTAPTPFLETTSPDAATLALHRPYLEWLGQQLGWSTNTQMDIVRRAFPSVKSAILVFTPQVLNPASPVNAIVNLPPKAQWGASSFDILQIEDYDWVTGDYDHAIGDRWELMKGTWDMALNHLGYPLSRIHYFTGYNLDASTDWKWAYIDAAGEIGMRRGAAKVFPWSREQVLRDGFIYARRVPADLSIQTITKDA